MRQVRVPARERLGQLRFYDTDPFSRPTSIGTTSNFSFEVGARFVEPVDLLLSTLHSGTLVVVQITGM